MAHEIDIYTPQDPRVIANDNSAVEKALRIPKLIDNELRITDTVAIDADDIPARAFFAVRKLRYVTHVSLVCEVPQEDISFKSAARYAKELTDVMGGVYINVQSNEMYVSNAAERFYYSPPSQYTPMIMLACYYLPRAPFALYVDEFVALLDKYFPFALPRKYGSGNDTCFELSKQGVEHFLEFIKKDSAPVWLANFPITHVLISDATRCANHDGFRVSRVALTMPADVWKYTEWQFALRRLLCGMMHLFDGFFAQLVPSDKQGVASWWWQGIPRECGMLFALGEPYRSLVTGDADSADLSEDPKYALYVSDNAPVIPNDLISAPQKRKNGAALSRSMFGVADRIPF